MAHIKKKCKANYFTYEVYVFPTFIFDILIYNGNIFSN